MTHTNTATLCYFQSRAEECTICFCFLLLSKQLISRRIHYGLNRAKKIELTVEEFRRILNQNLKRLAGVTFGILSKAIARR